MRAPSHGPPPLPPYGQLFIIGIWVESVLYGINIVVFTAVVVILLRRYQAGKSSARLLLATSTVLFLLSTAYVSISCRELLEAYVWGPPGGANLYFADASQHYTGVKLSLALVNIFIQDVILIWRMWVVYNNKWTIIILPILGEIGHVAAGISSIHSILLCKSTVSGPAVPSLVVYWGLDFVINIGVTGCIIHKLWSAGRTVKGFIITRDTHHPYLSVIFIIVESGGILAMATLITLCLYLSRNPAAAPAIDSVVQFATLTPLLIVVRVAFGLQRGVSVNETTAVSYSVELTQASPAS
ncbi:hypothetical protein C8R41DRAFT_521042 [Lentinula lateritia]|uniref:Family A G protein-coupled receptor-like protein n=1 Tax=Lentinula lateritia TaxID=40482 RepID=A0ABQ8V6W0_9AGAR|nr:hypothetical protein C8R41DRAFT_521042 [Lentinula lateritia]